MGAVSEHVSRLLLSGLHSTLWLRQKIYVTFEWFWISLLYFTSTKHKGTNLESIGRDSKLLIKVPKHLALLVQQEKVSYDDLARLIMWAFASGITTVSLYDSHGKIVEERMLLQSRLSHHHQMFSPPMPDIKICTSQELKSFSHHSSSSLLHHDTGPYQVVLLSPQDGRQRMVEVAVYMCEAVLGGREELEEMDTDTLTTRMIGAVGMAEPEVALIFGDTCSTMGYPPWHLRLSEIQLASHHKMLYWDFHQVLQKYSACKHRLGK